MKSYLYTINVNNCDNYVKNASKDKVMLGNPARIKNIYFY